MKMIRSVRQKVNFIVYFLFSKQLFIVIEEISQMMGLKLSYNRSGKHYTRLLCRMCFFLLLLFIKYHCSVISVEWQFWQLGSWCHLFFLYSHFHTLLFYLKYLASQYYILDILGAKSIPKNWNLFYSLIL